MNWKRALKIISVICCWKVLFKNWVLIATTITLNSNYCVYIDLFLHMIAKPTQELFLKEDSQTLTEASSELTTDNASITECKQDPTIEDEAKKEENKIKYRKLKQKLSNMGFNHDDKCVVNKDFSSPKKQRIMKLALDFEKMIKIQNRDY